MSPVSTTTDVRPRNMTLDQVLLVYKLSRDSLSSYCMSDFLCSVYGIPLTPSHVPERPEGSFCTVIKPPENSWSSQQETQPRGTRQPVEGNGPFASRDYRYHNGGASNQGTTVQMYILKEYCHAEVL